MYLMAKTITVNIDDKTNLVFRDVAAIRYGKSKGSLGKALTEAMNLWIEKEGDVDTEAIKLLEKGFRIGGLKIKDRAELHER